MQAIIAPEFCPSCDSSLEWKNDLLYCLNTLCPAQVQKRIEHFAKSLKIKGLGPKSIEKLDLSSFQSIYDMTYLELRDALSSEKLAIKLLREINSSKKASMNEVLPAFSIPLIGKTAAQKLSTQISNLFDLTADKCKKAGLGPKATESLLNWYSKEFLSNLEKLPFTWTFEKPMPILTAGVVCISGKLSSYKTKADATNALEGKGYQVKSSITKDVTILVNESGIESAKTKNARDKGITIITNLMDLIGEQNGNTA